MAKNYQGKIRFSQDEVNIDFAKANVSLSAEKLSKSYENIKGDFISMIKGYKYSAKIDLFLLNSDESNSQKLNQLLYFLSSIRITIPLTLSFFAEDGNTILVTIPFHDVSGDIAYTDYLSQNANIGLKFSFELETLFVVSKNNLISGW